MTDQGEVAAHTPFKLPKYSSYPIVQQYYPCTHTLYPQTPKKDRILPQNSNQNPLKKPSDLFANAEDPWSEKFKRQLYVYLEILCNLRK